MKAVDEVKALALPDGEYLVIGSGIMSALGIRDNDDVDLLVAPRLFEELRSRGWEYRVLEIDGRRRERLSFGKAEAYTDFWYGNERADAAAMIAGAEVIDGVAFQPLADLLKMKRILDREKDRLDIALIEKYLDGRGE